MRAKCFNIPQGGKSRAQICCKSQHISTTSCSMDFSPGFGTHICMLFYVFLTWSFFMPSVPRFPKIHLSTPSLSATPSHKAGALWSQGLAVLCCSPTTLGQGYSWTAESQEGSGLLAQRPRLKNAGVLGQIGTSIYTPASSLAGIPERSTWFPLGPTPGSKE